MKHERRAAPITTTTDDYGGFTARVLRYGAPADDYGTIWVAGVANEYLDGRLPVLAWSHGWDEPLGRCVAWREVTDGAEAGLYMDFVFDDPDDVPRARQARSQIRSGTLTDVSVGFMRVADQQNEDGTVTITKAEIDEVSIVLRGAVSGAKVLAVRSGAQVPADVAGRLGAQLVAGDIDAAEFFAQLKAAAITLPEKPGEEDPEVETPAGTETDPPPNPDPDPDPPDDTAGDPPADPDAELEEEHDPESATQAAADLDALLAEADAATLVATDRSR